MDLDMTDVKKTVLECLENVGVDVELESNSEAEGKNVLTLLDSLQYVAFIAEIESLLGVNLADDFLLPNTFKTLDDFAIKLEYYVKGWKESLRNNFNIKGGEQNETEEVEKNAK